MPQAVIIDDVPFMRSRLKQLAEGCGCFIAGEAGDMDAALQLVAATKPDLVIMDITLPNTDVPKNIKAIKAVHPEVAVLVCSAINRQQVIAGSIMAGAEDYIVKPFFDNKMIMIIQEILSIRC